MSISQLSPKSMEMAKITFEEYDFFYDFEQFFVVSFDFDSQPSRVVNLDKIMIIRRQRQGCCCKK